MNKKMSKDEFAEEIFKYAKNTYDNIELLDGHIIKIKGLKDIEEEIEFGLNMNEHSIDDIYTTYQKSAELNLDWAKEVVVDYIQRLLTWCKRQRYHNNRNPFKIR